MFRFKDKIFNEYNILFDVIENSLRADFFALLLVPFISLTFIHPSHAQNTKDLQMAAEPGPKKEMSEKHPAYEKTQNNDLSKEEYDSTLVGQTKEDARDVNGFFANGQVDSFYGSDIKLANQPKLTILNTRPQKSRTDKEDEILETVRARFADEGRKAPSKEDIKKELLESDALTKSEKIQLEFGKPEEEPSIVPEQNAPNSYKALIASIEAGDDELAYKYARQYVKYQRNFQERVKKVADLSNYAFQEEGLIAQEPISEDPNYDTAKLWAEKNRIEKEKAKQNNNRRFQLDEKTRELLKIAERDEDKSLLGNVDEGHSSLIEIPKPVDEKTERDQARQEAVKSLPADSKGKALVYFFFRPADSKGFQMNEAVEKLYATYRDNPDFNMIAFTLDRTEKGELEMISKIRQMTMPLRSGSDLAIKLGVKNSPTTVFISPSSGVAYSIEGLKTFAYLDEFIKHLKGEK